ncbi:hypothetical protein ACHSBP_19255 [Pseudoalteromonas sp. XMcav1-K]|uniref:hypothetical protein n=1 Tax=Pseudoalteromonas sp. XMcav1-K TaxID=3374372 RepID=UPI00375654D7
MAKTDTAAIKKSIIKIAFESSLIIFSVLLALFLNEYRGQLKAEQEKLRALQMIQVELNTNLTVLTNWTPYHKQLIEVFDNAIIQLGEAPAETDPRSYILELMPKGLMQDFISRTAWESLQQASSDVSLDIETTFLISKVYKLQQMGVEKTLMQFVEVMNSREGMRADNLKETLYLLKSTLQELHAQEKELAYNYQNTLTKLKNRLN